MTPVRTGTVGTLYQYTGTRCLNSVPVVPVAERVVGTSAHGLAFDTPEREDDLAAWVERCSHTCGACGCKRVVEGVCQAGGAPNRTTDPVPRSRITEENALTQRDCPSELPHRSALKTFTDRGVPPVRVTGRRVPLAPHTSALAEEVRP